MPWSRRNSNRKLGLVEGVNCDSRVLLLVGVYAYEPSLLDIQHVHQLPVKRISSSAVAY